MLQEEIININIINTISSQVPVSILGNPNPLDNANQFRREVWDLSAFTFSGETTVSLLYKNNSALTYNNITGTSEINNIADLVNFLNKEFQITLFFAIGNSIFTYNDNVILGDITLNNSVVPIIDPSFVYGTGFDNLTISIAMQTDGKILVGGLFSSYNGTGADKIIRLNTDGTVDSSFVYGTGFDSTPLCIAVQADGKIIIGGAFLNYNGTGANRIIRLNTDGTVDGTFTYGTGFDAQANSVAVQADGKIIVVGTFTNYNGTAANRIIRLNTDGTVDGTFTYGTGFDSNTDDVVIQADGKIVIVGSFFTDYNGTGANGIIRLNTDGTVDGTFVYGTGFTGQVLTINIQSDGKLIIGGQYTAYNGTGAINIIRLNTNGSIDTSFIYGTGFNNFTGDSAIMSNGDILLCGSFTDYNGTTSNRIVRVNNTGTLDTTFNIGTGFNNTAFRLSLNPINNRVTVTGNFTSFNGTAANRIIRLNN